MQYNYYNTQLSDIHLAELLWCVTRHTLEGTWNNEMSTMLSSNFQFMVSYGWLLKCLQYNTATSSTYTIMYPISTIKKWALSKYLACKNVPTWWKQMRGVNSYSQTTMSIISTHLKYMNTLNFQNILALLDIHDFCPSVKLYQCTVKIFLKIPRK